MTEHKACINIKFKKKNSGFYEKTFPGFNRDKHRLLALRIMKKKDTQLTLYTLEKSENKTTNDLPVRTFQKKYSSLESFFEEINELHITIEIKE